MMDLMFHVVLECEGIHPEEGDQAATNITEEFSKNPWHHNPKCTWDKTTLRLEVDTPNAPICESCLSRRYVDPMAASFPSTTTINQNGINILD